MTTEINLTVGPNPNLGWTVVIKRGKAEGVYKVKGPSRYTALTQGITLFLKENKLPGKPYEYLPGKTRSVDVEVSARCHQDKRRMEA